MINPATPPTAMIVGASSGISLDAHAYITKRYALVTLVMEILPRPG